MRNSYTAVVGESVVEQIIVWIKGNDNKIRYLPDAKDGWINVRFESGKNKGVALSVPQGLKVRLDKTESERDYYTLLEGWDPIDAGKTLKGVQASSRFKNGRSRLVRTNPQLDEPAFVKLNLTKRELSYNGKVIPAFTQEYAHYGDDGSIKKLDPLPVGLWKIKLPINPHDLGDFYLSHSRFSKTWFHIETPDTDDRFIHVGGTSHGCATIGTNSWKQGRRIKDFDYFSPGVKSTYENWTNLYNYLIFSRIDDKYVGTIEVEK